MKYLLLSMLIIGSVQCKVAYVPSPNTEIKNFINNGASMTDSFYLEMINATDKSFAAHESTYDLIDALFIQLTLMQAARPNNAFIISQTNRTKEKFDSYRDKHKANGVLNVGQLETYRQYMQGFWLTLQNSERFLE